MIQSSNGSGKCWLISEDISWMGIIGCSSEGILTEVHVDQCNLSQVVGVSAIPENEPELFCQIMVGFGEVVIGCGRGVLNEQVGSLLGLAVTEVNEMPLGTLDAMR